ncbi:MAG: peptide/nickel transport system permease protein [Chloroflexota bacterium]|jgi:peptide/nickel transport system permease protein|nr:peptide/nickel transport system permease protein [Chloroflexota bacterium]
MATLVGTRPPAAAALPRIPTRLLIVLAAVAAGNLLWYFGANALDSLNQVPDAGRDALHSLLYFADVGIALFMAAEWMSPRLRYFTRRLVLGAITVFIIVTLVYFVINAIPGEKWYSHLLTCRNCTQAHIDNLRHVLGIDRPVYVQYLTYLNQVLAIPPNLGYSTALSQNVWDAIATHIGPTAILMGTAYIVQMLIAIPVGVISAVKPYSKIDNFVTSFSFFGISLPNYWFGSMLIYLFAILPIQLGHSAIFPVGGQHTGEQTGIGDLAWHLVLPVIVLAVQGIAQDARYTRSAMLDVLGQDYIRTARAKGLSGYTVIMRHAFRNSLLPIITLAGLEIPQLFAGAIITEFVFNWHGMGQLTVNQAESGDLITVVGIMMVLASLVVIGNIIADLAYTLADPRITFGKHA